MEQSYMSSILYYQYHGHWCPGELRTQDINRMVFTEYTLSDIRRVNTTTPYPIGHDVIVWDNMPLPETMLTKC